MLPAPHSYLTVLLFWEWLASISTGPSISQGQEPEILHSCLRCPTLQGSRGAPERVTLIQKKQNTRDRVSRGAGIHNLVRMWPGELPSSLLIEHTIKGVCLEECLCGDHMRITQEVQLHLLREYVVLLRDTRSHAFVTINLRNIQQQHENKTDLCLISLFVGGMEREQFAVLIVLFPVLRPGLTLICSPTRKNNSQGPFSALNPATA